MSQNVEVVRQVYERWQRDGGFDPARFQPDFEIRTPLMEIGTRHHRGQKGFAAWRASHDGTERSISRTFAVPGGPSD